MEITGKHRKIVAVKNIINNAIFFILFAAPFLASSQKLSSKQHAGVWLPHNSIIDGQSTEWNDQFQAYNNSTGIFYTIANDDKNLYLIIKATDQLVIRKIIAGSITVSVNATGNKKDKNTVAITYPVFDEDNLPNIKLKNQPVPTKDANMDRMRLDSFMNVANKQVVNKSKKIKITGSRQLDDSVVSIYNQNGIKAGSQFDNRITYTCELMVPFRYLNITSDQTILYYDIRLNGSEHAEGSVIENIPGGVRVNGSASVADMQFISSATNFSGEYTMAKK